MIWFVVIAILVAAAIIAAAIREAALAVKEASSAFRACAAALTPPSGLPVNAVAAENAPDAENDDEEADLSSISPTVLTVLKQIRDQLEAIAGLLALGLPKDALDHIVPRKPPE